MKLILASSSPRRFELMTLAGLDFSVKVCEAEELKTAATPGDLVMQNALLKARGVSLTEGPEATVIGADTVVFCDGRPLGKPSSDDEAREMLTLLSGRSHSVFTGICVTNGEKTLLRFEETKVFFKTLTPKEIDDYIKTLEHRDKAGAYAIQGRGGAFVRRIEGCYSNVIGLPLVLLTETLREFEE